MICTRRTVPPTEKAAIRSHYDLGTPFYRLVWGPHIHHGLWSAEDAARDVPETPPRAAQERLTDTLAALASIGRGDRVLDVGCGVGGSSIHLAGEVGCRVTGITLSGVQRRWATMSARITASATASRFSAPTWRWLIFRRHRSSSRC